ncbi:MAG: DHH family phosphoesterase [Eubacterium sp. CAG76_36_125]|uniref:DHH family phosphoesterase n=1 Tax=[Lactobacillus] rogosae TaxID=706562 RepID=UPI00095BB909|nr:MAG: DHH family phosphoesterase [Eubacterium sp. CAG76_36_125]
MNNKQTKSFKPSGRLNSIFLWPVGLGILLVLLDILLCFVSSVAASIVAVFIVIYAFVCAMMICYFRPRIIKEIVEFSSNYSQVQRQLLYELSIPYCLLDNKGNILWMNASMQASINRKNDLNKNISTIIPELSANVFRNFEDFKEIRVAYNDRDYRVEMKRISADIITQGVNILAKDYNSSLVAMYMFDETDINQYIQKIRDERFVVGLVYIDNYEDALESVDDVRRSLFVGLVDKRVNKYFSAGAAIIRKLEKDKYLVVFRYKFLEKLLADKFSLVEDIKSVKVGNEKTLTLSIAIGTGAADYARNYDIAKAAMDLALGRGGDQAVIKDGEKIYYYGGKSQQMEKNTRVKVRVKAHALRQILEANDNVLIMGHNLPDIDSFGSALGIYIIAKKFGKEAHIVFGEISSSVRPFMNRFIDKEEYPDDMFIKKEEAENYLTASTVVIVVDVNRPQRTECPQLLDKCKTIIVFDHHRRSSDTITGAVLSYVDPYASSACEMVTEMIQYVDDGIKLKAFEADALYAGISIDTDGFNSKSGPRTFEAAAFLRRHGADVTRVRKMLRNDMNEYKAIASAVSKSEVYKSAFAITVFDGEGLESPTIGGAKAANQLLDISGIKASFVITQYEDKLYISARSIDEVNVQLVMEKLGGGGHMSIAGAQLTNCTIQQAVNTIKLTLDNMLAEGEI